MFHSCILGSSVPEISQARILEWVVISFSRGSSQPGDRPKSPALEGRFFTTAPPGKPRIRVCSSKYTELKGTEGELLSKLGETGSQFDTHSTAKESDYIIQTSLLLLVFVLPQIPLPLPLSGGRNKYIYIYIVHFIKSNKLGNWCRENEKK